MINHYDTNKLLRFSGAGNAETMKFRLAILSDEKIIEVSKALAEAYGSRIRKNYVVLLLLKGL